jgi:hypothetical protein
LNYPLADRSILTTEIEAAFVEGRAPLFPMGNLAGWCAAFDELLNRGVLEPVMHAMRYATVAFPTSNYVTNISRLLERIPPVDERSLSFSDVFAKDVQIVPRENAETVMLVFCGRAHRAGLPLNMLHRWLGRLPASLVYLRDFRQFYYLAGVVSLGDDRGATLTALRRIVSALGGRRVVCYGNSGGVFAALHYGLDLKAEAVLCLSGTTNISRQFNSHPVSGTGNGRASGKLPDAKVDLRRAYRIAERPPRARIVYAEHNWDDRLHAEYMRDLPTVTLQAVPGGTGHNVIMDLVRRGEYEGLLQWLLP